MNVIVKPDNASNGTMTAAITKTDDKLITAITALKTAQPRAKVFGLRGHRRRCQCGDFKHRRLPSPSTGIALYPGQLDGIFSGRHGHR